jgi:ferredoxin
MIKKIKKYNLRYFFEKLKATHRVIGPKIENSSIILAEIEFADIPYGYRDQQGKGSYRISKGSGSEIFSFSNSHDSFKRFLHPPSAEIFTFQKDRKGFQVRPSAYSERPIAFLGIRGCDIAALKLYDRIFLESPVRDKNYQRLRSGSMVIALNCIYPGDNCFCSSMGTGPEVKDGFDTALTELDDSFLIEVKTVMGGKILEGLPLEEAESGDMKEKDSRIENCRRMIKKSIRAQELPSVICRNLEHPRWTEIAKRDLECGNCTQVCPTCFCNSSYEHIEVSSISKKRYEFSGVRIRTWDSCFSKNFARVHGGNFRPSRRARYRQWMSHKLAYTFEQFGLTGCVGCGRCITWCPAGIDITEELEALHVR